MAFYQSGGGVVRTDRQWSNSTVKHIKAWLDYIGMDVSGQRWPEIQERFPQTMPQEELTQLFRDEAVKVRWSKRQAARLSKLPDAIPFYKSDSSERVSLDPNRRPPRDWEKE